MDKMENITNMMFANKNYGLLDYIFEPTDMPWLLIPVRLLIRSPMREMLKLYASDDVRSVWSLKKMLFLGALFQILEVKAVRL